VSPTEEQLQVARTLAGNSRAIVQLGNMDEMLRFGLLQDTLAPLPVVPSADGAEPSAVVAPSPASPVTSGAPPHVGSADAGSALTNV
jgi:hypothetical protein